jgi:hypothetical protein
MSQLIRAGQGASCRASGSAPLPTRLLQARRSPASADRCIAQSLIAPRRVHTLEVDMRRQMERGRVWLWSAAGVGIVAITLAGCGRTGIAGCDAPGVKKAPYVAKNRAILRSIPVYQAPLLSGKTQSASRQAHVFSKTRRLMGAT